MADPVLQIERVHECLAALQVERQEPAPIARRHPAPRLPDELLGPSVLEHSRSDADVRS